MSEDISLLTKHSIKSLISLTQHNILMSYLALPAWLPFHFYQIANKIHLAATFMPDPPLLNHRYSCIIAFKYRRRNSVVCGSGNSALFISGQNLNQQHDAELDLFLCLPLASQLHHLLFQASSQLRNTKEPVYIAVCPLVAHGRLVALTNNNQTCTRPESCLLWKTPARSTQKSQVDVESSSLRFSPHKRLCRRKEGKFSVIKAEYLALYSHCL